MSSQKVVAELLVRSGVIDRPRLETAIKGRTTLDAGSLGRALEQAGLAGEEQVAEAIAKGLSLEYLGPSSAPTPDVAALVPKAICHAKFVVPLGVQGHSLRVAMSDPLDYMTIRDIEFRTNKSVAPVVASRSAIERLLSGKPSTSTARAYDLGADLVPAGEIESVPLPDPDIQDVAAIAKDTTLPPVIRLINLMLSDAAEAGASDIHVEPQESSLHVRWRIDGVMQDALIIPKNLQDAAISRLKIMSGMDISDRRRPQDGRLRLRLGTKRLDVRVSTLPTHHGEKVVMRLLDSSKSTISLDDMSFAPALLNALRAQLSRPQGMVLVTGPTGSGKTSTLYAALNWLKSSTNNIVTVEDPVEYQIEGLNQVQINTKAGVTFATGLRSILRQDPDIILVGEIRDQETAKIALEAAQTGHLLLSTLHTNDATAAITRLIDLGIEPFLVSSALLGVLGQRLVRKVCPACAASRPPDAGTLQTLAGVALPDGAEWKTGAGCQACAKSGYKGRIAVHELMVMSNELRDLIAQNSPEHVLRRAARKAGLRTLLEDGIDKAARGITTLEEVVRVLPLDSDTHAEPATLEEAALPAPAPQTEASRPRPTLVVDNSGVSFAIEAASPAAAASAPPTAAAAPGHEATARILVVDDSPTIASVVKYFLELEGYEVVVAEDGAQGLHLASKLAPDLIVSDVNMPAMDGVSFVRALRGNAATSDTPFLFLTSEASVENEAMGLAAGADDFLPKPVEPKRLTARVKALLARSRARRGAGIRAHA